MAQHLVYLLVPLQIMYILLLSGVVYKCQLGQVVNSVQVFYILDDFLFYQL